MDITLSDGSDSDPDFPTNSNSTQSKKNYEHTMTYAKKNIIYIYTNIQNIEYFFFIEIGIWLILLMAHIASLR